MKEKISAFMDGELDEHEMQNLIQELYSDVEHRDCWQQYHLIGDALRNNLPPSLNQNFVHSISQAIANDDILPPVVTPIRQKTNKRRHRLMNPFSGFAIAASVAVVAYVGIGVVAIDEQLAVPGLASNADQLAPVTNVANISPVVSDTMSVPVNSVASITPSNVAKISPVASVANISPAANIDDIAPVISIAQSSMPQSGIRTVQGQQWQTMQPAVQSRLENYISSHRNVIGSTAMSSAVIPPARLLVIQQDIE